MAVNPHESYVRMDNGTIFRIEGAADDIALSLLAVPLIVRITDAPVPLDVRVVNTLTNPVFTDEKQGNP